ncbi:hypothetical protein VCHA53O466_140107 [Vibrio chagasii]|nr:hypothetical protein VCHA53O466_140107 [Vibrio chagasii]
MNITKFKKHFERPLSHLTHESKIIGSMYELQELIKELNGFYIGDGLDDKRLFTSSAHIRVQGKDYTVKIDHLDCLSSVFNSALEMSATDIVFGWSMADCVAHGETKISLLAGNKMLVSAYSEEVEELEEELYCE